MPLLRGNTASEEWIKKNPGKTYEDWLEKLQEPAREAAAEIRELNEQMEAAETVRQNNEDTRISQESERTLAEQERLDAEIIRKANEQERLEAEAACKAAETIRAESETDRQASEEERRAAETIRNESENIRNKSEDKRQHDTAEALEQAGQATGRLNELCDNRDKVIDGYWWSYNEETKEYENTGEIAKGNLMYATFAYGDGRLIMRTDVEYDGPRFRMNKYGRLKVII
ncbi:MAG: hypothetical protein LUD02_01600 [Tannerellaceae bacterium]|nr:hypothetical protein [Tannerellaceae bacterium]